MSTLNVLIFPETIREGKACEPRTIYVAIGLEKFIAAQGETAKAAMENLQLAVLGTVMANQAQKRPAFDGIAAAPAEYLQLAHDRGADAVTLRQENAVGGFSFLLEPKLISCKAA